MTKADFVKTIVMLMNEEGVLDSDNYGSSVTQMVDVERCLEKHLDGYILVSGKVIGEIIG